jgi:hypothetical protein
MSVDENGQPIAEELDENGNPLEKKEPEQPEAPTPEELADLKKRAGAFEDQKKRAENAEGELKKLKEKPTPSNTGDLSPDAQKRLDRIELNSLGIKDRDEQDFVLGAAKRMGVDPSEAANDEFVSAKLEKMREARKTKEATPAPKGGGGSTSNVTRLAEKALQTGELPTDPKLREQVRAEMKRISK